MAYIILGTGSIETSSLHSSTVGVDEEESGMDVEEGGVDEEEGGVEREGNSEEGWSSSFTCNCNIQKH